MLRVVQLPLSKESTTGTWKNNIAIGDSPPKTIIKRSEESRSVVGFETIGELRFILLIVALVVWGTCIKEIVAGIIRR